MVLRVIINEKGKAWRIETEEPLLNGMSVGDKINGNEIKPELEGYELEITGGSDDSGFPMSKDVEGLGLKRLLLTKGWGMWRRPRRHKKEVSQPKGLRMRKTVRGKIISEKTAQINLNVLKVGSKKLADVFSEQNKAKEKKVWAKPEEAPKEVKEKK